MVSGYVAALELGNRALVIPGVIHRAGSRLRRILRTWADRAVDVVGHAQIHDLGPDVGRKAASVRPLGDHQLGEVVAECVFVVPKFGDAVGDMRETLRQLARIAARVGGLQQK